MRASRAAKSILTTKVSGSADLCDAMHTNIFPRTFSVGCPHVVVTSTSGNVRPIASTSVNLLARGIGVCPGVSSVRAQARGGDCIVSREE